MFASKSPGLTSVVMEPTFGMLASIIIPDLEEMLEELEIPYTSRKSPFPQYFLQFEDGVHEIRMYSAENYMRLVGFKCAAIFLDEFETIEKKLALEIYRKCVARLRQGEGFKFMAFFTTPDQFGFCYDFFVESPEDYKALYRGKTTENFLLPQDYIDGLYEAYPANLIDAFLNGEWVNLNADRVYDQFDRQMNGSTAEVEKDDILYIGIDFNVNIMAATVFIIDDGNPIAVDEFYGSRDTSQLIKEIRKRYPKHEIMIYPDASGTAEKTNAPSSDIQQLRAEFGRQKVRHHKKNPLIETRINCVNNLILNGKGVRRFKVNIKKCPNLTKALEQQPYKDGKPDKKYEYDDCSDSMGYFLFTQFQVSRPSVKITG